MDKQTLKAVSEVISFLQGDIYHAEKYLDDKLVVRGTRRRFKGKLIKGNIEIILVIGKPNYKEREFIKLCKKAKEPFPIKGVQIKINKK
jgi:predicted nucleotidyltransferase